MRYRRLKRLLNKLLNKRFGILSIVIIAALVIIANASIYARPACGCGSINDSVLNQLKQLDGVVKEYVAVHRGIFPTYEEVATIYHQLYPDQWEPTITPEIDVTTGALTFTPASETAPSIAYATSADRHRYMLRGVGVSSKYLKVTMFGRDFNHFMGLDFPILTAADPYPDR